MGPMVSGLPVPNFLSPHQPALTYALVLLVLTIARHGWAVPSIVMVFVPWPKGHLTWMPW